MRKDKENAIRDFIQMIEQSRTWARLDYDEKTYFLDFLNNSKMVKDAVKGTYENRWAVLNALYYSFLSGCGYTPLNWREN